MEKGEITIASKATEYTLAELHSAVGEYLLKKLRSGAPEPSDVSNAIKYLKDNCIKVDLKHDNSAAAIEEAVKALPEENPNELMKL